MAIHPLTKPFRQFVREARKLHGLKYQYVEGTYKGARPKMTIICPLHKKFQQAPGSHLAGHGCKKCAKVAELEKIHLVSLQRLKDALLEKSGGTVTVDEKTFKALNKSARFVCKKHKAFRKRAYECLDQLHPCTKCGLGRRKSGYTDAEAFNVMRERAPNGYRVTPFKYEGPETLITIDCGKHKPYTVKFSSTHRGIRCRKCSHAAAMPKRKAAVKKVNDRKREANFEDWLRRARERHSDKFDYSRVQYKTMKSRVLIGCPHHGFRRQTAEAHLTKGCRKCADEELGGLYNARFFEAFPDRMEQPASLYYVRISIGRETFYKVGVTVSAVKTRFSASLKEAKVEVLSTLKTTLYRAFTLETELQRTHGDRHRFRPSLDNATLRKLRIGPSECFSTPLTPARLKGIFSRSN